MVIREAVAEDWAWINANADAVGGPQVVSNSTLHTLADYPAGIAVTDDSPIGFVVYIPEPPECELLAINVVTQYLGVGSKLMGWAEQQALQQNCTRMWLATTNDNLDALRFYQRRGYRLCELHRDAFADVLAQKGLNPKQRVEGNYNIIIHDELILEKTL